MKQLLIAIMAGSIFVLLATNEAHAQKLHYNAMLELKKQNITLQNSTTNTADPINKDLAGVNQRALKDFSKLHKKNVHEDWSVITDGFAATYYEDDIRHVEYYNKKGRWSGSLKGYTEDKLGSGLREQVKSSYYDFNITYVQEVQTLESNDIPTFIIHLEDKNRLLLLRIYEGEMDLWQEYRKEQ